ncbi:hypothetical protein BH695_0337 [Microcystis aeruginosa PCC 7806SL]|uniref:Uncharacterized protein n=1 Tax=Microcystis aeruginosa PCC 7806SL TaxID=1903187 RepID=A0AB33BJB4_MICA7|nr:hypothetical protein BH695_0337 [Microcystis aeruginosa PCC 7806SL]
MLMLFGYTLLGTLSIFVELRHQSPCDFFPLIAVIYPN